MTKNKTLNSLVIKAVDALHQLKEVQELIYLCLEQDEYHDKEKAYNRVFLLLDNHRSLTQLHLEELTLAVNKIRELVGIPEEEESEAEE